VVPVGFNPIIARDEDICRTERGIVKIPSFLTDLFGGVSTDTPLKSRDLSLFVHSGLHDEVRALPARLAS